MSPSLPPTRSWPSVEPSGCVAPIQPRPPARGGCRGDSACRPQPPHPRRWPPRAWPQPCAPAAQSAVSASAPLQAASAPACSSTALPATRTCAHAAHAGGSGFSPASPHGSAPPAPCHRLHGCALPASDAVPPRRRPAAETPRALSAATPEALSAHEGPACPSCAACWGAPRAPC